MDPDSTEKLSNDHNLNNLSVKGDLETKFDHSDEVLKELFLFPDYNHTTVEKEPPSIMDVSQLGMESLSNSVQRPANLLENSEGYFSGHSALIEDYSRKVDDLNKQNKELKEKNLHLESQVADCEAKLSQRMADLLTCKMEVATYRKNYEISANEAQEFKAKMDELTAEVFQLKQLKFQKKENDQQISILKKQLSAATKAHEKLKNESDGCTAEMVEKHSRLKKMKQNNKKLWALLMRFGAKLESANLLSAREKAAIKREYNEENPVLDDIVDSEGQIEDRLPSLPDNLAVSPQKDMANGIEPHSIHFTSNITPDTVSPSSKPKPLHNSNYFLKNSRAVIEDPYVSEDCMDVTSGELNEMRQHLLMNRTHFPPISPLPPTPPPKISQVRQGEMHQSVDDPGVLNGRDIGYAQNCSNKKGLLSIKPPSNSSSKKLNFCHQQSEGFDVSMNQTDNLAVSQLEGQYQKGSNSSCVTSPSLQEPVYKLFGKRCCNGNFKLGFNMQKSFALEVNSNNWNVICTLEGPNGIPIEPLGISDTPGAAYVVQPIMSHQMNEINQAQDFETENSIASKRQRLSTEQHTSRTLLPATESRSSSFTSVRRSNEPERLEFNTITPRNAFSHIRSSHEDVFNGEELQHIQSPMNNSFNDLDISVQNIENEDNFQQFESQVEDNRSVVSSSCESPSPCKKSQVSSSPENPKSPTAHFSASDFEQSFKNDREQLDKNTESSKHGEKCNSGIAVKEPRQYANGNSHAFDNSFPLNGSRNTSHSSSSESEFCTDKNIPGFSDNMSRSTANPATKRRKRGRPVVSGENSVELPVRSRGRTSQSRVFSVKNRDDKNEPDNKGPIGEDSTGIETKPNVFSVDGREEFSRSHIFKKPKRVGRKLCKDQSFAIAPDAGEISPRTNGVKDISKESVKRVESCNKKHSPNKGMDSNSRPYSESTTVDSNEKINGLGVNNQGTKEILKIDVESKQFRHMRKRESYSKVALDDVRPKSKQIDAEIVSKEELSVKKMERKVMADLLIRAKEYVAKKVIEDQDYVELRTNFIPPRNKSDDLAEKTQTELVSNSPHNETTRRTEAERVSSKAGIIHLKPNITSEISISKTEIGLGLSVKGEACDKLMSDAKNSTETKLKKATTIPSNSQLNAPQKISTPPKTEEKRIQSPKTYSRKNKIEAMDNGVTNDLFDKSLDTSIIDDSIPPVKFCDPLVKVDSSLSVDSYDSSLPQENKLSKAASPKKDILLEENELENVHADSSGDELPPLHINEFLMDSPMKGVKETKVCPFAPSMNDAFTTDNNCDKNSPPRKGMSLEGNEANIGQEIDLPEVDIFNSKPFINTGLFGSGLKEISPSSEYFITSCPVGTEAIVHRDTRDRHPLAAFGETHFPESPGKHNCVLESPASPTPEESPLNIVGFCRLKENVMDEKDCCESEGINCVIESPASPTEECMTNIIEVLPTRAIDVPCGELVANHDPPNLPVSEVEVVVETDTSPIGVAGKRLRNRSQSLHFDDSETVPGNEIFKTLNGGLISIDSTIAKHSALIANDRIKTSDDESDHELLRVGTVQDNTHPADICKVALSEETSPSSINSEKISEPKQRLKKTVKAHRRAAKKTETRLSVEATFQSIEKMKFTDSHFNFNVHNLVNVLINPENVLTVDTLILTIVEHLHVTRKNPMMPFSTSRDPEVLLPLSEKCIVTALFQIDQKAKLRFERLLPSMVKALYHLIISKHQFPIYGASSLCRVLTEICKRLGDRKTPLLLVSELLKTQHKFAPFIIASIIGVWQEPFQVFSDSSDEDKIFLSAISYGLQKKPKALNNTQWKHCKFILSEFLTVRTITNLREMVECVIKLIRMKCLLGSYEYEFKLTTPLVVYSRVNGFIWAKEYLLDEYILPSMTKFSKELNETAFEYFCNLYADVILFFSEPEARQVLANYYYQQVQDGVDNFVRNIAALGLLKITIINREVSPPFIVSWMNEIMNSQDESAIKIQENMRYLLLHRIMMDEPLSIHQIQT